MKKDLHFSTLIVLFSLFTFNFSLFTLSAQPTGRQSTAEEQKGD